MKCIKRYKQFMNEDFDHVILEIKYGNIKAGMYTHLVKVNENKKLKGGEFFGADSSEYREQQKVRDLERVRRRNAEAKEKEIAGVRN